MSKSVREATESPKTQGVDEALAYAFDFTNWGLSSLSSPTVVVKDVSAAYADVTSTVMPTNSPSTAGAVVTTSLLRSLTNGHTYRVECRVTSGGAIYEMFCMVQAEL